MNVLEVVRDRLHSTNRAPLILKEAQIIQGKIMKIYPNQKAEIKIGSQTLIAEISAPLTLGKRYLFEVQGLEEPIHLKVIGEANTTAHTPSIRELLEQLGLSQTKTNIKLVKQLVQEKIPFRPGQVKQATILLENMEAKPEQMEVVKELIAQKLPLTEAVFQAVHTQKNHSLSHLLSTIMTMLQQKEYLQPTEEKLRQELENMLIRPATKGLRLIEQLVQSRPTTERIQLFQLLKLIQADVNPIDLSKIMQTSEREMNSPLHSMHMREAEEKRHAVQQVIKQVQLQNKPIEKAIMKLMEIFPNLKTGDVTTKRMSFLSSVIESELSELLPREVMASLQEMIKENRQSRLYEMLQYLPKVNHTKTGTAQFNQFVQGIQLDVDPLELNKQSVFKEKQGNTSLISLLTNHAEKINNYQVKQMVKNIQSQALPIEKASMKLMGIFPHLKSGELTTDQMALLNKMIDTELGPLLPTEIKASLKEMIGTNQQTKLYESLQLLSRRGQMDVLTASLLTSLQQKEGTFLQMPVNEQFTTHLKRFLDGIGMKDEFMIRQALEQTQNLQRPDSAMLDSVKSMLLQLMAEDNSTIREQAPTLVHLINGMQMNGMIQSDNTLQATLQLPGEKIALHEDIFLQFEGQKKQDGKINPDYCRIMFVLHLHHMEETMIDVHIQKRIVSLHVYNDKIKENGIDDHNIREILNEKLSNLHYQLSTIAWKPLYQEKGKMEKLEKEVVTPLKHSVERYDYKI